jgi:hypothetical protein
MGCGSALRLESGSAPTSSNDEQEDLTFQRFNALLTQCNVGFQVFGGGNSSGEATGWPVFKAGYRWPELPESGRTSGVRPTAVLSRREPGFDGFRPRDSARGSVPKASSDLERGQTIWPALRISDANDMMELAK